MGSREKAAIDCNGYRHEMDLELQRIGGEIVGCGYRMEMEHAVILIANGFYGRKAILAFQQLEEIQERGWLAYAENSRGNVSSFDQLQREHLILWNDWRDTFGLNQDPDDDEDDDD